MQTQQITKYSTLINATPEKVWDALTNPAMVKQYFFGTELICDWQVGSEIIFQGEWEGQKYKDKGIVLTYEPAKKLSYSYLSNWSGKEDLPENYLMVSYEVEPQGNGTSLTITQSNYDAEKAAHSEGNWATLIEGLKKLVE